MLLSIRYSIFTIAISCMTGFLLFTGVASAQQTETFATSAYLSTSSNTNNFILPSFNTSLGTLESVDLTLNFNLCPGIQVFNDTSAAINFTNASLTQPIDVAGPDSFDYDVDLIGSLHKGTANPGVNTFWLAGGLTSGTEDVDPDAFDLWENQPKEKVSLTVSQGNATYGGTALGNGLFFGGKASEWGKITVQYTYQAVPEPSGRYLSAIVAAALMLILIGRKTLLRA